MMKTGVALQGVDPPDRFIEMCKLVESLGYGRLWITDSSLIARYVYVYLTLAAIHTRLEIGTAVTNPLTRHPALAANAIATIGELNGGRVALGIGAGDRPLLELGLEPAPRRAVREMVAAVRGLTSGQAVTTSEGEHPAGGFTLEQARLHAAPPIPVPVYIAASGPKMLQLAGEIADGVIVLAGLFPEGVQYALDRIAEGAARSGRSADDLDVTFFAYGSLSADSQHALEETRSIAAWFAQTAPHYCELLGMSAQLISSIREQYSGSEFHQAAAAASLVPDDAVRALGLTGTVDDCRAKLAMLCGLGVQHVTVFPLGGDRSRVVRLFAEAARSVEDPWSDSTMDRDPTASGGVTRASGGVTQASGGVPAHG